MFTAAIAQVDYHDPWDLDFDTRFAMLMAGAPRAAYFYTRPDTSTFRYRTYNVSRALAGSEGPSASWFTEHDTHRMGRVLDNCDLLVICRNSLYSARVAEVAAQARSRSVPIWFDVDDLVFDATYTHLLMDTLAQDTNSDALLDLWYSNSGRIGATFRLCDGAFVTNDFLAERARDWSGKPARVLPNALNREQQDVSARIWDAKAASGWARDNRLHLGYFSGSPSHNRDFEVVAGTVARLMDRHEHVWLRVVGFLDDQPELNRHRHRIESVPLQDFINLQREIGAVEVNLVPLQDNDFTNSKSELKWFEAAIVGSLTVATPTHAYRNVIEPGVNGWLATAQDWDPVLESVVADFKRLDGVRDRARKQALQRFGWEEQGAIAAEALFGQHSSRVNGRVLAERPLAQRKPVDRAPGPRS